MMSMENYNVGGTKDIKTKMVSKFATIKMYASYMSGARNAHINTCGITCKHHFAAKCNSKYKKSSNKFKETL